LIANMAASMRPESASQLKRPLEEGQQGPSSPTIESAGVNQYRGIGNGLIEGLPEPASKRVKLGEEGSKNERSDRREKVHGIALVKAE
jgi:hypothetical protein